MRITSWNFLHGQRTNPAENKALSEVITEFDSEVIALQEVDWRQARSGGLLQPAEIAEAIKAREKCDWGFAPTLVGTPGFKWRKLKGDEEMRMERLRHCMCAMNLELHLLQFLKTVGRSSMFISLLCPL